MIFSRHVRAYRCRNSRQPYLSISSSALCKGALEALITPSSGRFISRTIKMAEETDKEQKNNNASTVAFRGANSPKLKKRITSQKIRKITNIDGSTFCC